MAFTSLWANDNWPTSRATINTNFTTAQANLDTKVEFSWTVPAIGDMAVFDAVDGLWVKKKVFTASQVLESDVSGQPTSAAKGTAYNKNYWTSSGTTLEGSNDALYMKLAGTQTVTGDKTFSGALTIPSATVATTQSPWDSSTKVATTAFVSTAVGTGVSHKWGVFTKDLTDANGATTVIAHGLWAAPVRVRLAARIGSASFVQATSDGSWDSSGQRCVFTGSNNSADRSATNNSAAIYIVWSNATLVSQVGTVTVDATNITITWAKTNAPTGSAYCTWEANN